VISGPAAFARWGRGTIAELSSSSRRPQRASGWWPLSGWLVSELAEQTRLLDTAQEAGGGAISRLVLTAPYLRELRAHGGRERL